MYVRVLSFSCRPGIEGQQIVQVYRKIVDTAEEMDGFNGATLLMSEDACRGLAMVYWRDRQAAAENGPILVDLMNDKIYDLLDHPPDIAGYDLVDSRKVFSS